MSIVTGNPRDYLKHVSTADEAARLDDDLAETIARDSKRMPRDDDRIKELKAARRELHSEYPEILERAFGETAGGEPRPGGLGPSGKKHQRSGQAVTRSGRNQPKRPPRAATRRPSAPRRGGRRRGGGWLGRSVEQTGVPGAARSATANALEFFGVLIGLSLAYLLLSNAQRAQKGRSAVELLAKGIATGVQRVVSPDPAFGKPAPTAADLSSAAAGVQAADQAIASTIQSPTGALRSGVAAVGNGARAGAPRAGTVTARGRTVPGKQRIAANP